MFGGSEEEKEGAARVQGYPLPSPRRTPSGHIIAHIVANVALMIACFKLFALHLPRNLVVFYITFCGGCLVCRQHGVTGGAE
jgi:hypothetical protein